MQDSPTRLGSGAHSPMIQSYNDYPYVQTDAGNSPHSLERAAFGESEQKYGMLGSRQGQTRISEEPNEHEVTKDYELDIDGEILRDVMALYPIEEAVK